MGVLNANQTAVMEAGLAMCLPFIKSCMANHTSVLGWLACFEGYDFCNMFQLEPIEFAGINPCTCACACTRRCARGAWGIAMGAGAVAVLR